MVTDAQVPATSSPLEILLVFLRLGCSCFGGPIAHLGYFRSEFVERRQWLTERAYVELVALAQFLPGPASSQTGFGIGLVRGGWRGGLAAWAGFTLPSAVLLILFAYGAGTIADTRTGAGLLHGLKLAAVAIVAQAVLAMARSLCPDRVRASIATVALIVMLVGSWPLFQMGAIALGGLAGWLLCRGEAGTTPDDVVIPVSRRAGGIFLAIFVLLLAIAFVPAHDGMLAEFNAFYRSGALVFGGGHVVLPLLHGAVVTPGWVSDSAFLAGYGAAQAVPGPLFTFAAYLGAVAGTPPGGVTGAIIALVGIFIPGMLCLLGTLPFWHALRGFPAAQAAMRGTNAAVVGLLGAALYDPVWTSAVLAARDLAVAATGFVLLTVWRAPPLLIVALSAIAGAGLRLIG
ncbi:chromate efflux transporter [Rhodopila sp.]|uniref:chromate efflux transporter n=1 Tax=Rhodopila sp. TaxID=2480087 RepID=UPI002C497CA4|nr:chromate efflux transporter [Rhodopila sp.]HVZ10120.1 chromate efflux transporter [Rhodopila sp.]